MTFVRVERSDGAAAVRSSDGEVELVELVSPRTNSATYSAIEHVFAALAREGGVSLEIGGDATARRFYARLRDTRVRALLESQLRSAYPQTRARSAVSDPARCRPGEQVRATVLGLRGPEYLPLRVPRDAELLANRAPQTDPLLGVLAALGGVPVGWRALAQLVLLPAPADWARPHLRRAVEHALEPERAEAARSGRAGGWGGAVLGAGLLVAVVVLPRLWSLYLAHGALAVALVGAPATLGLVGLYALWLRLSERPLYDLELVKQKLTWPAARCELRLAVFAPFTAPESELQTQLEHLIAAYQAYDLQRGNGLVARQFVRHEQADALRVPRPIGPARRLALLGTRELAALWHLVQAADDVSLVERTTARRFLPLPETVAEGARLGVAEDGLGQSVAVHLAPGLLRRHALLVAKTRKGKSGLLRRIWQQLLTFEGEAHPTVVLVDPHSDLAQSALGLVPPAHRGNVVYLDVGQASRRPFGLNLLDVGLGWSRDQLVENALRVFKHEFDNFWGPRMELVFRLALLLLVDANRRLVAADPTGGRNRQFTVLEVPRVLEDDRFRRRLLADTPDAQVQAVWRTYFDQLDRRFRTEVINPVQTKAYKFGTNVAARAIVGQSRSTIDPLGWVRDGAVVVVDVAKEQVGTDIAAMIGGTLINLLALAVGQQATLPPYRRRHVALLVDEFHALPAANYEAFLAELAKYGASLVLATQSLGALDEVDPGRGLRHAVFANVDHLFAFNCSAEDASLLAPELGAPLESADLVELGEHQCYARLGFRGERLPAFHLRLDPPAEGDEAVRQALVAHSATVHGRPAAVVAADRAALLEQIDARTEDGDHDGSTGRRNSDPENGRIPPASAGLLASPPEKNGRKRNERRARRPGATQPRLDLGADGREVPGSAVQEAQVDPGEAAV